MMMHMVGVCWVRYSLGLKGSGGNCYSFVTWAHPSSTERRTSFFLLHNGCCPAYDKFKSATREFKVANVSLWVPSK
jgi:hypothetical protein